MLKIKMKPYSLYLFDADRTLFDFDRAQAHALRAVLKARGIAYSEEVLRLYIDGAERLWRAHERGEITIDRLQTARFEALLHALGLKNRSAAELNSAYLTDLSSLPYLIDGAVALCASITASGAAIAVITNGITRVQKRRILCSDIAPYVAADKIFVSEEIGFAKPDARFFDYVFDKLGIADKRAVLVVGDSLASDIKGGRDYGLDTCYFNPSGGENASGIVPTYDVRTLGEIAKI